MQCGLSAGKQKLTVILVQRSSMQVTKGTWRMREQCVPGSFSSSPAQEPGNEAREKGRGKVGHGEDGVYSMIVHNFFVHKELL